MITLLDLLIYFFSGKRNRHYIVIDTLIHNETLNDYELSALLMTICHLFQMNYIVDTRQDIISKIIDVLKNPVSNSNVMKYVLSILYKILIHKDEVFTSWKHQVNMTSENFFYVLDICIDITSTSKYQRDTSKLSHFFQFLKTSRTFTS